MELAHGAAGVTAVWITLRDLVVRPFALIEQVVRGDDTPYVGPIRLTLGLAGVFDVLATLLLPSMGILDLLRFSGRAEMAAALTTALEQHGVDVSHFEDRFSSRIQALQTAATVVECGLIAMLLRFFRKGALADHLAYAFYLYAAYLVVAILLVAVMSVASSAGAGWLVALGAGSLVFGLPAIIVAGMPRFYPARWPRQVVRSTLSFVAISALSIMVIPLSQGVALAWTMLSFGI